MTTTQRLISDLSLAKFKVKSVQVRRSKSGIKFKIDWRDLRDKSLQTFNSIQIYPALIKYNVQSIRTSEFKSETDTQFGKIYW